MDASASDVSGRLSKRTSVASSRVPETDLVPLNFSHTSRGIKNELLLHEAAIKNDVATLKHLIESKVDVNARTHMERVPLHWAAAHGHLDAMAALIQAKCDVEVTDKYGMRPLLMAAWFGHRGAVQLLVESGASCRAVNRQGQTTLHCAAQNNHHEVLAFMLDSTETIKVNAIDKNGQTALHIAAINNCMEIVEKLLQYKADPNIKDKVRVLLQDGAPCALQRHQATLSLQSALFFLLLCASFMHTFALLIYSLV